MTTFGVAGPSVNPIGLTRLGFDVLLKNGLTLGAAIGFGAGSLGLPSNGGQSESVSGWAFLISPRVGYRIPVAPWLDLVPRAGVTVAGAGLTNPNQQVCTYSDTGQSSCTSIPGDRESLFFAAASAEVVLAARVTRSFNLLAGAAYDHVFAATGSSTSSSSSGASTSTDNHPAGTYLGAQLWLGLGGYL